MTDGGRQCNLEEIKKFLPHIAQHDLILGYRSPRRDPLRRRLHGWGLNLLVRLAFGSPVRDVDCAFKPVRRDVLDRIAIESRGATLPATTTMLRTPSGGRI